MDPRDYQDFVDYLASPEGSRKWPNRFDDFDSKEKNQAKRNYRQAAAKFALHEGVLVRADNRELRVITEAEKINVMRGCHDGVGGGHLGMNNTAEKIRTRFWWKGFSSDVEEYVRSCPKCQTAKPMIKRPATLHPVAVPTKIFRLLGMDLVGPLNLTTRGNRYILVIADYLTKWPEAFAIPSKEAVNVAEKLFEVICRQSVPDAIISDQGREFCNAVVDDLCERMQTKRRISTAYHPQSNGLTERFNQSLLSALKKHVNNRQNDWDEHINTCLFAYRTAKQSSTKASPYQLVYGCQPQLVIDLEMKSDVPFELNDAEFEESLVQRMKAFEQIGFARSEAHENIAKAQKKQTAQYNKRHCPPNYIVGQLVCLENKRQKTRKGDKLLPEFGPPVKITDVFDNGTVKVEGRKKLVNVADIQPYFERQTVPNDTVEVPNDTVEEETTTGNENVTADSDVIDESDIVDSKVIPFAPIEFDPVDRNWQRERADHLGLIVQRDSYPYPHQGGHIFRRDQPPKKSAIIAADGNCLFNSISYLLTGSQNWSFHIRHLLIRFIESHKEVFRQYTPNKDESLEAHLNRMTQNGTWGTDLEIYAAATLLNTTNFLYAPYANPMNLNWTKFKPLKGCGDAQVSTTTKKIFMSNISHHFTVVQQV